MSPEASAVIEHATAVAFLSEAGQDKAALSRVSALYDAVILHRLSLRETVCAAASRIALLAGVPGSVGLAASHIRRRRCRLYPPHV